MKIDDLREKLNKIFIPMPPETYVQYYIDNDMLPKKEEQGPTAAWSKENPYKICWECKESLHITKYYVRRTRTEKYGYLCILSLCMDCSSALYDKGGGPKAKVWAGSAEKRGKKAKKAIMNYFDNKCNRCGYEGQAAQMDLDHLNPKEKEMMLAAGHLSHSTPEDIIKEVAKCQMVCSNCHRLISTKAEHQKESLTYLTVGEECFSGHPKGILERMSAPEPDREHLRHDS
jgi:hypothetical protein